MKTKAVIGIILNPKSRKNIKTKCASVKIFKKIAGDYAEIQATNDIDELKRAIRGFKSKGIPYIGISGGDGTIHHVVTHLINIYKPSPVPPILLLRDGTMNNIATSIGLKSSSEDLLKEFIAAIKGNKSLRVVQRDTIRIEDTYCFLFGFGLTSNVLNKVYFQGKGIKSNIKVIGQTFAEAFLSLMNIDESSLTLVKTMNVKISIDGKKVPFAKVLTVLAGTVESIGMGFSTIYRANDQPGTFHVLVNGMKPHFLVRNLQKIMTGQRIDHPLNIDEVCGEMKIIARERFDYTMDGDMYVADRKLDVYAGMPLKFIIF
jgi:diacylglycerol kinase family enzyme